VVCLSVTSKPQHLGVLGRLRLSSHKKKYIYKIDAEVLHLIPLFSDSEIFCNLATTVSAASYYIRMKTHFINGTKLHYCRRPLRKEWKRTLCWTGTYRPKCVRIFSLSPRECIVWPYPSRSILTCLEI
jgi:hypothetical protein